jgi:teichuronic acid biosynthesis glycosyltransferase TuaH
MTAPKQIVLMSLERWDDVWRRNQLLVNALTKQLPGLEVLFSEPPVAALRNLHHGRPPRSTTRPVEGFPGVTALRAVEWTPARLSPYLPLFSARAAEQAAFGLGFDRPLLWINNHSYARFALSTGWPVVYDITDDWLLSDLPAAMHRRAVLDDEILMRDADAVVVCSPALAVSRGTHRGVTLIPNGVDVAHFATPQPRPADLCSGPVAVYVGALHDERLDVALCCNIADELPDVTFVYVGPNSLTTTSRSELGRRANVRMLGPRPYAVVPAYLQNADAICIPHRVSPFTESLDPIKARECLAVGTPTVATPVAGFRELGPPVRVCRSEDFASGLRNALESPRCEAANAELWTWDDAARMFCTVLEGAIGRA